MKQAVVIIYDGSAMTDHGVVSICEIIKEFANSGSKPLIAVMSENDIAKALVAAITPPEETTEEGDAAIIAITAKHSCVMHDPTALLVHLSMDVFGKQDNSIINAVKIIGSGKPYSASVAKKAKFTKKAEEAVCQIYKMMN